MIRQAGVGCLTLAALCHSSTVSADQLAVALSWDGPSDCGDDGSVAREIARILGESQAASSEAVSVTARVTKGSDGKWLVSLRTKSGDQEGERSLVGTTCTEVRRATALIVALMIDPNVQLSPSPAPPEPSPAPPVQAKPAPQQGPREPMPKAHEPAQTWAPRALVGIDALAGAGTLPSWALGAELRLGIELGRITLELGVAGWLPRRKISDEALGAGGEFSLWGGSLSVCHELIPSSVSFGPCIGAGARHVTGEGFGVSAPGSASANWGALLVRWFARYPLGRSAALRATLGADFPFRVPTFSLAGLGEVYTPSPIAGELTLGAEVYF